MAETNIYDAIIATGDSAGETAQTFAQQVGESVRSFFGIADNAVNEAGDTARSVVGVADNAVDEAGDIAGRGAQATVLGILTAGPAYLAAVMAAGLVGADLALNQGRGTAAVVKRVAG